MISNCKQCNAVIGTSTLGDTFKKGWLPSSTGYCSKTCQALGQSCIKKEEERKQKIISKYIWR